MGGSISKIFGGGGSKPAPAPAPTPEPAAPVKSTRAERVAASRRRRSGTGYRGLLGAQRFGAGDQETQTTLGVGS